MAAGNSTRARVARSSSPFPKPKRPHRPDRPEGSLAPATSRLTGADELLESLSSRLALVETVSLALQTLEDRPEVGSISAALELAVAMLARVHEDVDHFVQRVRT